MQQTKPVPKVGTIIKCDESALSFKNSNVPCIRVVLAGNTWVVGPSKTQGLMVYLTKPHPIEFSTLRQVRITAILGEGNTAHAEVIQ